MTLINKFQRRDSLRSNPLVKIEIIFQIFDCELLHVHSAGDFVSPVPFPEDPWNKHGAHSNAKRLQVWKYLLPLREAIFWFYEIKHCLLYSGSVFSRKFPNSSSTMWEWRYFLDNLILPVKNSTFCPVEEEGNISQRMARGTKPHWNIELGCQLLCWHLECSGSVSWCACWPSLSALLRFFVCQMQQLDQSVESPPPTSRISRKGRPPLSQEEKERRQSEKEKAKLEKKRKREEEKEKEKKANDERREAEKKERNAKRKAAIVISWNELKPKVCLHFLWLTLQDSEFNSGEPTNCCARDCGTNSHSNVVGRSNSCSRSSSCTTGGTRKWWGTPKICEVFGNTAQNKSTGKQTNSSWGGIASGSRGEAVIARRGSPSQCFLIL